MFGDKMYTDFDTCLGGAGDDSLRTDVPSTSVFEDVPSTNVSVDSPNKEVKAAKCNQNKEEDIFYGQRETGDIRIVLLGRTGSGKSATGNTILTKKEFTSRASGSSITEQCQIAENRSADHRYLVVDTPGLFDTKLPQGAITREIIRCIHMSIPGPHAFLLVLRLDRYTQEEIDTFSCLFDLFGEKMSSYAILLFTRLDDLEAENITIEDFINSSSKNLKNLVDKVGGRYIAFNNRGKEEEKMQQISNLNKVIEEMIRKNDGKHYTNKMYEEAEANLRKKLMEAERIKELEKQKEVKKIESKFEGKISEITTSNRLLENEISEQKKINASIQLEKQETQATIQHLKVEMKDISKAHGEQISKIKNEANAKMEKLQKTEDDNNKKIEDMKKKISDADSALTILQRQRQTSIDNQNAEFKTMMAEFVKSSVVKSQNDELHYKRQMADIQKTNNELLAANTKMMQSLQETRNSMQEKENSHDTYIERMTSTVDNLRDDLRSKDEEFAKFKVQQNKDSCLIM